MNFADVSVPGDLHVPVDISSTKTNAHVNVHTLDQLVTIHKFSIVTHVSANVHTNRHVSLRMNSIPTHVLATASPNLVRPLTTLRTNLVAASVAISTLAPSTVSLTERPVNASVPDCKSVDLRNDSTQIHVNVSAPTIASVRQIRFSTAIGADASASTATNTNVAERIMYLTTIVVTVYVIVTVPHRTF